MNLYSLLLTIGVIAAVHASAFAFSLVSEAIGNDGFEQYDRNVALCYAGAVGVLCAVIL